MIKKMIKKDADPTELSLQTELEIIFSVLEHFKHVSLKKLSFNKLLCNYIYIYIYIYISKAGERSRGRPKGSLLNSYYTEV